MSLSLEEQKINRYLWRYGYPWAPEVLAIADFTDFEDGPMTTQGEEITIPLEVLNLDPEHPARIKMLELAQEMLVDSLQVQAKGLNLKATGETDEETVLAFELPRCGCPDYAPPRANTGFEELGTGPWKSCHGVGDYHAVSVQFSNTPPGHLSQPYNEERTIFQEALRRVVKAYSEIGLLVHFSGPGTGNDTPKTPVQIQAYFVSSSSGWIGLALIGNNGLGCTQNQLWCQYLAGFGSNYSVEDRALFWAILILHELGHNCGLGHTSGGIMNPSINRTPASWKNDTAFNWMRGRFGGVLVPTPGPGPDPPPPPPPDDKELSWWETIVGLFKLIFGRR